LRIHMQNHVESILQMLDEGRGRNIQLIGQGTWGLTTVK
jgi:hypothetical protein